MTTIDEILSHFRANALTEKEKGTKFEHLMRSWLRTDPRYSDQLEQVWLWDEFPARDQIGEGDTGIDLVAKTIDGDYWAIQCKCYKEEAKISKQMVDSFITTSGRTFTTDETGDTPIAFAHRLWIDTTTAVWSSNAEAAIQNQQPPVSRITLYDLRESPVDWDKLLQGVEGDGARTSQKKLRPHQSEALAAAHTYYTEHDRGQMIMACGTGKTFTSLRLIEQETAGRGLILFLVPSIALLGQSLNDWYFDAQEPIQSICICSDSKASRSRRRKADDLDDTDDSPVDLALPATTRVDQIVPRLRQIQKHQGLKVVFSTYQSIDVIAEAQRMILKESAGAYGIFDFIVCDEAHRTTGVKLSSRDESHFTKVHDNQFLQGRKRLYMTATPRLYGESAKVRASRADCILCSMDDPKIYGEEFYRLNFSHAVDQKLLTDYKVLVLTVSEEMIPPELLERVKSDKELNYDDTSRLIGVINALSKNLLGDKGATWDEDPRLMRRALAFAHRIGAEDEPGSSRNVAHILPEVSKLYNKSLTEEEQQRVVHVAARHVDGGMNALERGKILQWLEDTPEDPQECRVVTNVRCLSEGVDIPALDAVLFLSARNSQVDVVQSVGRVMRTFGRGTAEEKRYGYIIIPVVVPETVSPEEALNDNKTFANVWQILNALRSHDDNFNAHVNTLALNKDKGTKITVGLPGFAQTGLAQQSTSGDSNDGYDALVLTNQQLAKSAVIQFDQAQQAIYAKLVEKCGDRLYWENWAAEVGEIAKKYIARISRLVLDEGVLASEFDEFVKTLQHNLNPGISPDQCIEMLAQHLITRPVFDALFKEYQFVSNNSISSSMELMVELLDGEAVSKDLEGLSKFYDSVRTDVGKIDNLAGKQTVIKDLYEKFFKRAFPLTVEKLGTVYTPIECVDFIIHSVDDLLRREFGSSLTQQGVHILDPFTGTGTFVTRLLQSGLIAPADMVRKYREEIHANEIILLAYYIADVNIESVFQEICPQEQYLPYDGLCLTDTFQLGESEHPDEEVFKKFFRNNSDAVELQRETPIRVIIGNPPYSVGQRSANDNAQNQSYPHLEQRIAKTYVDKSKAKNNNALYDSYIKAYRWAADRLAPDEGGIIAFISNGAWIDGLSHNGFRASLQQEFDKIYVYNLRGNARTSGELRKREGGGIFDSGSRTPIAITFLVRYPRSQRKLQQQAEIYYHDIGDYLSREEKLQRISSARSYSQLPWTRITPNDKQDWINQRDDLFDTLIPLTPNKKFDKNAQSAFTTYSCGVKTNKDPFLYNFSKNQLRHQNEELVDYYNKEREQLAQDSSYELKVDPTKIVWAGGITASAQRNEVISLDESRLCVGIYRPFVKQAFLYQKNLIERTYQQLSLFPTPQHKNLVICVSGVGSSKPFSCLITDHVPSLDFVEKTQCFPLYWYEEEKPETVPASLFGEPTERRWVQRSGITDWMLREVRSRFGNARSLTREDIFYYIYGVLHSEEYRTRFADDLRKALPRIPIVERLDGFMAFSKAGRQLAEMHLHYESYYNADYRERLHFLHQMPPPEDLEGQYDFYRVEKLSWFDKGVYEGQRNCINYNKMVGVSGIPKIALEYVVNGKSAIEWIMERYAVTTDKKSGITNDPNLWCREQGNPRYILNLLRSVIHLSVDTMEIVRQLPSLALPSRTDA